MEVREYLWNCMMKWTLKKNAYCHNQLYHTKTYYINIPTMKVAPLHECMSKSLVSFVLQVFLKAWYYWMTCKMLVVIGIKHLGKTFVKWLQNHVTMKMKCTVTAFQREGTRASFWEKPGKNFCEMITKPCDYENEVYSDCFSKRRNTSFFL